MRLLQQPRTLVLLTIFALACTGGTFSCSSGDDDGDKIVVDGNVNT